jgi:hypothetical protein
VRSLALRFDGPELFQPSLELRHLEQLVLQFLLLLLQVETALRIELSTGISCDREPYMPSSYKT